MSLIKCPSCKKQISNKVKICSNCQFEFNQSKQSLERLRVLKFRKYRDKMFQYKMFGFVAIALAICGLVPMLWTYAKAIDYGFNATLTNHWGKYVIMIGFILYLFMRVLMYFTKRKYKLG